MMTQAQENHPQDDIKLNLTTEVQTLLITAYQEAKIAWEKEVKTLSDKVLWKCSEINYLNEEIKNHKPSFFDRFLKRKNLDQQTLQTHTEELQVLQAQLIKLSSTPPDADRYELAIFGPSLFQGYGALK